jgi:hypothetical protein
MQQSVRAHEIAKPHYAVAIAGNLIADLQLLIDPSLPRQKQARDASPKK